MSDDLVALVFMAILIFAGTIIIVSFIKANEKIKISQAELESERLREKDKENDDKNGSANGREVCDGKLPRDSDGLGGSRGGNSRGLGG